MLTDESDLTVWRGIGGRRVLEDLSASLARGCFSDNSRSRLSRQKSMKRKFAVVALDDHPVARLAVRCTLADHVDLELTALFDRPSSLLTGLAQQRCDVLITDLSIPEEGQSDGLSLLRTVRSRHPCVSIIVLSMYDSPALMRSALKIGASAFISKCDTSGYLIRAVRAALRGERFLTPRSRVRFEAARARAGSSAQNAALTEREVYILRCYLAGDSLSVIAESLGRSVKTVGAQRTTAMRKLWIETDAHLFEYAAFAGIEPRSVHAACACLNAA